MSMASLFGRAMTKTKSIAKKSKPISDRSPERVRASIVHPTLIDAFDVDWYYPWTLPEEAKKEKCVQRAIKEGWAEWIESPEDLEAVRMGYVFDLSRDKQGKPIYWHKGQWMRYQGSGKNRRLVAIQGTRNRLSATAAPVTTSVGSLNRRCITLKATSKASHIDSWLGSANW